jgi:hypothetical protein
MLSEMVRDLSAETVLLDVATTFTRNAATWGTLHDYGNIILAENSLVLLEYTATMAHAGTTGKCCAHKVKIGASYVSGFQYDAYPSTDDVAVLLWLNAGTYDVLVEGVGDYQNSGNYHEMDISNFKISLVKFHDTNDASCSSLAAYAGIITKKITVRNTPLGPLSKGFMHIQIMTENGAAAAVLPTVSVDGGGALGWDWSKTTQVAGSYNDSYGSVCGRMEVALSAGANHTVAISGGTGTHYISVVFSPWILPTAAAEVISLNFPQGSTIYLTTEPLLTNPTKYVKLGKPRAISFGDATDYYYNTSGTGILTATYTFEAVALLGNILYVYGWGGCISIIALDAR